MRREWTPEELIACWTLLEDDGKPVGNKAGATRLGFALLLKFFEHEGRFRRHAGEVPRQAVAYLAEQVGVEPALFAAYPWAGRTVEYHRAQSRETLGFRECAGADEARLSAWLAEAVCPAELGPERQREALLARCRVERLLGAARARAERDFAARTVARLPVAVTDRLEALVAADRDDEAAGGRGELAELRGDPGPLGLETVLEELEKLGRVRAVGRAGWYEDRQVGSHKQLRLPDQPGTVTVPVHAGRIIKPGTLGGILKDAGLTVDDLRALL